MSNVPAPGKYVVDPVHSTVGFVARHLVASKVRGNFTDFDGEIVIDEDFTKSSVSATVRTASVTTHNEQRDAHLRSADFFEDETYPTMTFQSTSIVPKGDEWVLVGDLTLKGVTKSVEFSLEYLGENPHFEPGKTVIAFEATTEVDRRDFNVNFNAALENGGLVVSNKITLELDIEALSA